MLTMFKPQAEKVLLPVARLLGNVNPHVITLLGLVLPVLFFVCVASKLYGLALILIILNALDMLDGLVARTHNKVTAFGGFLDATIDRFADFTVIAAFGFAGLVAWWVIMPLLLVSYLISYIRSRTELASKGTVVGSVGIVERTERMVVIFLGLAAYALWPGVLWQGQNLVSLAFVALIILSAITVGQRVMFAYRKL